MDKMKSKKAKKKKMKKLEHELVLRVMVIQGDASNDEDVSSREGSIHSQQDSDRVSLLQITRQIKLERKIQENMTDSFQEDSDLENYLTSVQEDMMEFKLSYEMWRVGRWAVSIPHVSYKYQWQPGMSRRLVICLLRLCKSLSFSGMLMFETECE